MSNRASQTEITEGKLKTALKLIKQKRYNAARQILREFPDNPKARAMLQVMEGKTEKRRSFSAISKRTLLMVGVVGLVFCVVIALSLLFVSYFSQYELDELFVMALATVGDEEAGLLAVAINYCKISQSYRPNTCREWPLTVFTDYYTASETCFSPYIKVFVLENPEIQAIRQCLYSYNVPRTY